VRQVNLCGGDGFMRTDFIDIVEESVRLGFVTDISTKMPLTPPLIARLAQTGLDYLQISIDSIDADVSDRLVGRQGHHRRLVAALQLLVREQMFVRTNTVITRLNLPTIPDTVQWLAELGVKEMKLTPAFQSFHLDMKDMLITEEDAAKLEQTVHELQEQWRPQGVSVLYSRLKPSETMSRDEKQQFWFHQRGICSGGRSALFVGPQGTVTLCEQVPHEPPFVVGDLRRQSILEVWNSPETLAIAYPDRLRFTGMVCETCENFDTCVRYRGHCFRDSWFANTTLYGPSPYCPDFAGVVSRQNGETLLDLPLRPS
jgi:radical SAM protein with 4Fe4S-binding SPASM domain